jgi:hypothetical protein
MSIECDSKGENTITGWAQRQVCLEALDLLLISKGDESPDTACKKMQAVEQKSGGYGDLLSKWEPTMRACTGLLKDARCVKSY